MHAVLPNIVDVDGLIRLSQESIDSDIAGWFERPGPHLVLVGRLSPEKNHIAALNGLARLHKSGIAPRLLFIGSGPMQHEIVERVNALGLQDIVFIAGQRSNPYPAISRADGLILPSTHEGQGLVLIEAMVLGTPVAATNIPGPASILRDASLGLLVPPTEKGIETALRELSSGNVAQAIFDGEGYEEDALQRAREVMRVS